MNDERGVSIMVVSAGSRSAAQSITYSWGPGVDAINALATVLRLVQRQRPREGAAVIIRRQP